MAIMKPVTDSDTILISSNAGTSNFAGRRMQREFLRHVLSE